MNHDVDQVKEKIRERFVKEFGNVPDTMISAFNATLDSVGRAMQLLAENGIKPVYQHQKVAWRWSIGEITDEEFIAIARAIAAEHGGR